MMLNAQLDRLRTRGLGDGITLVPDTPGAILASGFVWSRPFDALLASQVQARFGENVQVDSSMSSVSLTFNCGGQRMTLRLSRSITLGAEPDLALVWWFIALLVGAVTMAGLLNLMNWQPKSTRCDGVPAMRWPRGGLCSWDSLTTCGHLWLVCV